MRMGLAHARVILRANQQQLLLQTARESMAGSASGMADSRSRLSDRQGLG